MLRWTFTSRCVVQNAGGNAPIAKTLDGDLGFFARDLAHPRATGDTALNLEAERLGGRLGIGRDGKVDEIGHGDRPVSDVIDELRGDRVGSNAAVPAWSPRGPYIETSA